MADNVTLNSGTGGATAAADDIGGVHHQRVKLSVGGDGSASDAIPVAAGLDSTAAGIQAVGLVAQFDDASTATVTEDQFAPARLSSRRALLVEGVASGTAIAATVSGVSTSAKQDTIIGHVDGIEALLTTIDADTSNLSVLGSGTEAAAIRVTIATDSTGVLSIDDNGGIITVDGTVAVTNAGLTALNGAISGSEVQVDVVGALPAGTNAIGKLAANSGVDIGDVDITSIAAGDNNIGNVDVVTLPAIPAGNNNIGDVDAIQSGTWTVQPGNTANTTPWLTTPTPATSGGLTIFRSLDLDETEEEIKATAGQVYGLWFSNTATATRFLKFYNATAANVTVGTTTPVLTIALPGNASDDISGVFSTAHGIAFGTAITAAATTGVADNDTGAPGANEVIVNVFYK